MATVVVMAAPGERLKPKYNGNQELALLQNVEEQRPGTVRCGLWWAACLKLLLGVGALPAVRLPLLPAVERAVERPALYIRNVAPARALTPGPSLFPSPPPSQGEGPGVRARAIGVSS